jgi:hypothetical protein
MGRWGAQPEMEMNHLEAAAVGAEREGRERHVGGWGGCGERGD